MRIIIVGGGKVGYALAAKLCAAHNVTVIDREEDSLQQFQENLDVLCVCGNGASPTVLKTAGAGGADVVIAVTMNDEINMLCCVVSKKLGVQYTIARIRDPEFAHDVRRLRQTLELDLVINPELSTAIEMMRLLRFPAANVIDSFSRGRVELIGFNINEDDPIAGMSLMDMTRKFGISVLVCIVERDGEVHIPHGDFVLQAGDEAYVMGRQSDVTDFFKAINRMTNMVKNLLIVGGSRTALYLAELAVENGMRATIIERDEERCEFLADAVSGATILFGDGTDQELLESENIRGADGFAALTGGDEENLMIALFALQCNVRKVIAKANRLNYVSVVNRLGLDCVVSPREITATQILHFVRGLENSKDSDVQTMYSLLDSRIEALEFIVGKKCRYNGWAIKDMPLKSGILISVVTHQGRSFIPGGNDTFTEGDSVVVVTQRAGFKDLSDIFEGIG